MTSCFNGLLVLFSSLVQMLACSIWFSRCILGCVAAQTKITASWYLSVCRWHCLLDFNKSQLQTLSWVVAVESKGPPSLSWKKVEGPSRIGSESLFQTSEHSALLLGGKMEDKIDSWTSVTSAVMWTFNLWDKSLRWSFLRKHWSMDTNGNSELLGFPFWDFRVDLPLLQTEMLGVVWTCGNGTTWTPL